jgi:alpha-D-ribose 1-methylphosphonate 5-triphosphate synthase subunit PhnL
MANFIIKKGASMMGNGKIIKCTAMENYSIAMGNLHMKASGMKISLMGLEKFIMINLRCSTVVLITPILTISNSNGSTTTAN